MVSEHHRRREGPLLVATQAQDGHVSLAPARAWMTQAEARPRVAHLGSGFCLCETSSHGGWLLQRRLLTICSAGFRQEHFAPLAGGVSADACLCAQCADSASAGRPSSPRLCFHGRIRGRGAHPTIRTPVRTPPTTGRIWCEPQDIGWSRLPLYMRRNDDLLAVGDRDVRPCCRRSWSGGRPRVRAIRERCSSVRRVEGGERAYDRFTLPVLLSQRCCLTRE